MKGFALYIISRLVIAFLLLGSTDILRDTALSTEPGNVVAAFVMIACFEFLTIGSDE